MKHIRLYEYYSELPTSFSVADIQNMSETDFLRNFKMLKDKRDEEQAFSLLQIWMKSHQDAKEDYDFMTKLGEILPDASLEPDDTFLHNKAVQLNTYLAKKKRPDLMKQIADTEKNIKDYGELLRMAKERLVKLNFELTGTM